MRCECLNCLECDVIGELSRVDIHLIGCHHNGRNLRIVSVEPSLKHSLRSEPALRPELCCSISSQVSSVVIEQIVNSKIPSIFGETRL